MTEGFVYDESNPYRMTPAELEIAERVYAQMMQSMTDSDRSKQQQSFVVGISDLGYCSERLRRMLDRQAGEETDMLKAWIGTWLGHGLEQSYSASTPGAVVQSEILVQLKGAKYNYTIPGHPDIVDGNKVLDGKTAFGLSAPARHGFTDQQKQFQRHVYGYGAWESGLLGGTALEDVEVGNIWIDRAGQDRRLLVRLEPLDMKVVDAAIDWLDSVVYAYENGEEAMKEPAREICETTCGFYRTCRAFDTDVAGLLTDEAVLDAVRMHLEGSAMKKEGTKLVDGAKDVLEGVKGSTGTHTVRWIHVNGTETRHSYDRLQISPLKKEK